MIDINSDGDATALFVCKHSGYDFDSHSRGMNYFHFSCPGKNTKCGVECRHLKRDVSKIGRKVSILATLF